MEDFHESGPTTVDGYRSHRKYRVLVAGGSTTLVVDSSLLYPVCREYREDALAIYCGDSADDVLQRRCRSAPMHQFQVMARDAEVSTQGLNTHGQPELVAEVRDANLIPGAQDLLRYIGAYLLLPDVHVMPDETCGYGYSMVKFGDAGPGRLRLWGARHGADENTEFVPWVDFPIRLWQDQHALCNHFGAEFTPPALDQLAAISDGVYDGKPVEGVRYHTTEPTMSGWFLMTDQYNGDYRTLQVEHLYHVTAERPDLTTLIALPPGFRFATANGLEVWFDKQVALQRE